MNHLLTILITSAEPPDGSSADFANKGVYSLKIITFNVIFDRKILND